MLPGKEKFIERKRYNCTIITVASSATMMWVKKNVKKFLTIIGAW
jgi:hypothetical protein